jgi:two-component system, NarL family, nitrate/nitrite response regulator NarL
LIISQQTPILEKWHAALSLNYSVAVSITPSLNDFTCYAAVILDSYFIDEQLFRLSDIKITPAQFLILGEGWSEDNQVTSLAAGAAGYCEAAVPPDIMLKAIDCILQKDIWIPRHLIHRVIGALVAPERMPQSAARTISSNDATLSRLSKREQAVAQLITKGIPNKSIASALCISERTVKAHLTSIFSKLKVKNRLHLGILLTDVEE